MKRYTNKDIEEIIEVLDEQILLSEKIAPPYSPDSPTKKQKASAKKTFDDEGSEVLIDKTFNKLKQGMQQVKSKLSQFKRIPGEENDTSSSSAQTTASKFKSKQGTQPFEIDFTNINGSTSNYTFDADGTTKTVSGGSSCKFVIKSLSQNAVRCEGDSHCNGRDWLISFTTDVVPNGNNGGKISMFKDSSSGIKSNEVSWSGKRMNIKS